MLQHRHLEYCSIPAVRYCHSILEYRLPCCRRHFQTTALRLSGGFKGGYPAGGIALEVLQFFTLEFATWAEELGYYTGQDEQRIYMVELSLGF